MAFEDRIRLPALNLIHRRPRLLNLLEEFINAGKRLIVTYAPGGYGKSILLADFAQTTDLPVCWCSLEPADRDPTSFLTLLAHSITDRFHDIPPGPLFKVVERGETRTSIRRITDLLSEAGPHLIIIDDYHKAVSAATTLTISRLLEQLPPISTMIIAARGDLNLETAQIIELLLTDRAAGLSEEELRFTPLEVQRVILKRFGRHIDLDIARIMAQATDGNIAQILLTGHITPTKRMVGDLRQRLGNDRDMIYGYLAEEVFEKQAPPLQQFMLHTSVLPDMTTALCDALLGMTDSMTWIDELIRNDLFITQIGVRYRYHDLFAEYLRRKLAEDEATQRRVAIKAAQLLAKRGRFEEAVDLYLAVQAWAEATHLLETQGRFFYDTGRALTLNIWLGQISDEALARHPRLLLLRGQILNDDLGEPERAMTFFQRAEEQFLKQDDLISAAEAQVWRSAGLRMMGQANESLALAGSGLDKLKTLGANDRVMAYALRNRGMAHWTAGNVAEALTDFRQALALYEALGDTYRVGMCHHEIGICLVAQGKNTGADHHYKQALRIWEALGNANDLANTLNSLGVSLYTIGRYNEALTYFNDSLDIAIQIGAARRAAFAQAGLGDSYLGLQDYDRAAKAYVLSTDLAQEAGVRSLEVYNQVKLGECSYQQHDLAEALSRAGQAREMATEMGLVFEKGLAISLQAKIYVRQGEYEASFDLFAAALECFSRNDVLEQVKVRLWWGYGLLLDLRALAAMQQLQEAISLALTMGELLSGLDPTITETQALLFHFLNRPDAPVVPENIQLLLRQATRQGQAALDISEPALHVFCFGPPFLVVAGRSKRFSQRGRVRKAPEFLLYLILKGQDHGCRWSEVSAALWPDLDSNKASIIFHQTLRRFREAIFDGPDYIVVRDDYYQVNPGYLAWCDALAFDRLFERAAKAPPDEALALQLELVDLYHGSFLAGFELEEWSTAYRASCEVRFLQVVTLASEQLLKTNAPRAALTLINQGLAQDYFREELHRAAFKAYAELELYDHLAEYYAGLQAAFSRELDIPLDPVTTELYMQLMARRQRST
jgi:ATP/maltotriose-dependent transcriptional regulator MalT/two-component SAPR family response regulator